MANKSKAERETQRLLLQMHENGYSWRGIARKISTENISVSGALVRMVALGERVSPSVMKAIGATNSKPRTRFTAESTKELNKRYDEVCHKLGKSRAEMFELMVEKIEEDS